MSDYKNPFSPENLEKQWECAEKLLIEEMGEEEFKKSLKKAGETLNYYHEHPASIDDISEEDSKALTNWILYGDSEHEPTSEDP